MTCTCWKPTDPHTPDCPKGREEARQREIDERLIAWLAAGWEGVPSPKEPEPMGGWEPRS